MLVKWEGIVIRTTDYGEANKVLTLYTREHGKLGVMARGAKKPRSRLAAVSQLFTHGFFLCKAGPGTGMADLSQGDIVESYRDLRQDLTRTAYAAYIAELTDRLSEERVANPFVFHLLSLTFRYLDEGKDPEILSRIFESKMLAVAGIRPHLHSCTQCNREAEPYVFSVTQGGLLCPACRASDPYALTISPSVWKLLRLFQLFDLERLGEIDVKPSTRSQLKQTLHRFMDEHLDLRLKSRAFLEQLEKFPPA
ncbi:DNA repair protein RecO [Brevibacillus marinus]|uniref:DNA repair protein RecO n=1 Tax=Brevibacillus marinus TaxID=2496837 RepID=UPI000F832FAD|nr:DNA repair protein RecO [Brevibacillus marinus]